LQDGATLREGTPRVAAVAFVLLLGAACSPGGASPPDDAQPPIPAGATPAPELRLPPGFRAYVVAEGLSNPSTLALSPEGELLAGQSGGPVVRLVDGDGDGRFERTQPVGDGFSFVNGLVFSPQGELYISSSGRVSVARDIDRDGRASEIQDIITGLTSEGHSNNGLAFGPDGKLYVTNGSTCNDCQEGDERSATILQANPDGSAVRIYGRGLRNSYDLAFDDRGHLWATDNGSDPPCNTIDELNLVVDGGEYGWPYGPTCDSLAARGTKPVADLGYNSASTGIAFYDAGQFPDQYRGSLFVTLWGSHVTSPYQSGRKLVRVTVRDSAGGPRGVVEDFGSGFDRPVDVIVDRDGTLLVADWGRGKIYRIVYERA